MTCLTSLLQAQIEAAQDENRQLREYNAKLRESLRIMSESAGNWEREAKSRGAVDWRTPR